LRLYLRREETAARPDNFLRKCMRAMINHKMLTSIVILVILLAFATSNTYSLYKQYTLVLEQKEHEDMLTSFQMKVSQNANGMERIFFYLKNQLWLCQYLSEYA
jgi:PhoPQ-activated pathogenicity-related protein